MTIFVVVLVAIVGYIGLCLVSPERNCRWCRGAGLKSVRRMKFCRHCGGSGKRFRLGAQLLHRGATSGIRYLQDRGDE